jgi:hypothetical protein
MQYPNLGVLNRLLTEVVVTSNPSLNISNYCMGRSTLSVNPLDPVNIKYDANTGTVDSVQPYQKVQVTIQILKTIGTAGAAWEAQKNKNARIGDLTVYSDSTNYPQLTLRNCAIDNINYGSFDGGSPTVDLMITGEAQINSDYWV